MDSIYVCIVYESFCNNFELQESKERRPGPLITNIYTIYHIRSWCLDLCAQDFWPNPYTLYEGNMSVSLYMCMCLHLHIVYIAIEHPNHLNTMQKLFNQMWSALSAAADKAP